jgi:2-keto-4-pentenoate hydratase/2-oxohepta-3-ene-1,7-dioic acid hydratase in catechol pathway
MWVNGKPQAILQLEDTRAQQTFEVGSYQNRKRPITFRFEITGVYEGKKYDDTAISDLYFDGTSTPIKLLRVGDLILSGTPKPVSPKRP